MVLVGALYTKLILRCCRANRQLLVDGRIGFVEVQHTSFALLHMWTVSFKPCEQVQKIQLYKHYCTVSDLVVHLNFSTFRCTGLLLHGTAKNSRPGQKPESNELLAISCGLFGPVWYLCAVNTTGGRQQINLDVHDSQRVHTHFMLPGHES